MPFQIVRNDIVHMKTDAIVNSANPKPVIGSGTESRIYKKAGSQLIVEREKIGDIECGNASITSGCGLDAKYIIHVVAPVWVDGHHHEAYLLANCYRKALALAKQYACKSIAFPLLATGNNQYPQSSALQVAMQEIRHFLIENEMEIYLVVFDKKAFTLSEKLFISVKSFIDEIYVCEKTQDEYANERRRNLPPMQCVANNIAMSEIEDSWDNMFLEMDAGFSETLLKLIDRTGKKDSEIYKKANVDRKLFSKIRNNKKYQPSKTTALAFAFALELDIDETKDFIARAGYALSHSNKFDIIVEYFLEHENYDIFELNEVLFAFDQPLIGV